MIVCLVARRIWTHGLGGMETHCRSLAEELVRQGHRVHIVTTAHPRGQTEETWRDAHIHYLPETPPGDYSKAWWVASRRWAQQHFQQLNMTVILSESLAGRTMVDVLQAPPAFFIMHGYGWGVLKSRWDARTGVKKAAYFPLDAWRTLTFLMHCRRAFSQAAGVLAVSRELCQQLRRYRTHYVPNIVDMGRFGPSGAAREKTRRALKCAQADLIVLMVGAVNWQKGVDFGLRVCAQVAGRVPVLRVVVVGDGPDREKLAGWAARNASHLTVQFVGAVSNDALPVYYAAADLLLFPSRRDEGLPTVVLEAMATGLPVVATRSGGTPTAVRDDQTGFLTAIDDASEFAAALQRLLENAALRRTMGSAGRHVVEEEFQLTTVVRRLVQIMENAQTAREGSPRCA